MHTQNLNNVSMLDLALVDGPMKVPVVLADIEGENT